MALYIIVDGYVIIYTPFFHVKENIIVKEVIKTCNFYDSNIGISPLNEKIANRLKFPKVVLINPCVLENYPVPRLSLSVSILAAYLRKYQKAEVYIIDTQLGITTKKIIKKIIEINPDIIGVSIPHAQTKSAVYILEKIYKNKKSRKINSLVVIGNFIAASLPKFFMEKFPGIFVCAAEGEPTLYDLCEYVEGKKCLNEVSNLIFMERGKIIFNSKKSVDMNDIPLPALDTIKGIKKYKGALTHEWSRGCFWKCSFCPRKHKPSCWKGMSPETIVNQWIYFKKIIEKFGLQQRIYTADEETVGGDNDIQTDRMLEIAARFKKENLKIEFDSYARVDQVYNSHQNAEWHEKRIKMWKELKQTGLSRLFVGVESGSETQLKRYGKGIKPEDSIKAIRILSALGVNFRFGFMTFDPLMDVTEIKDNINFLERRDAFLMPVDLEKISCSDLFQLINDEKFVKQNSLNIPIYAKVSYMLASLEILINSPYIYLLKKAEKYYNKKLFFEKIVDVSIGRYKIKYLDDRIEKIMQHCQLWIDRNFSLMYTIKSLYKVATSKEREILMDYMIKHRELCHFLLKIMIYTIYGQNIAGFGLEDCMPHSNNDNDFTLLRLSDLSISKLDISVKLKECLNIFENLMNFIVEDVKEKLISGKIKDTYDGRLEKIIKKWENNRKRWILLNPI